MWMNLAEQAQSAPLARTTPPDKARWYVAQTLPRQENVAGQNLARQQFDSFLPRYRATRRHARKRYDVLAPLFPGYIFVRIDADQAPWRAINATIGIQRLIGPKLSRPLPMPTSAIDNIMARCRDGVMVNLLDQFAPGTIMRVTSGPFADQLVTIESHGADIRVRVLLNILGADQSIAITPDRLGPA